MQLVIGCNIGYFMIAAAREPEFQIPRLRYFNIKVHKLLWYMSMKKVWLFGYAKKRKTYLQQ